MPSIKVGVTLPVTGRYARKAGVIYADTYRFWVERINREGGLLGMDVELVAYDDASDPDEAYEGYRRLIRNDNVDLLLGPCHSDMVEGIAQLIEDEGRVLLQGSGSSHEIFEKGRRYVFLCWSGCDFDYPRSLFEWIDTLPAAQRPRRAALAYMTGRIGSAVALGTRHYARKHGVDLVVEEPIGQPPVDYDAVFRRVKEGAPDIVLVGLDHARPDDPLGSSVRAYHAAGLDDVPLWLSDNPSAHDPKDVIDRAFMRTTWVPESPVESSRRFVEEFQTLFMTDPEYHHAGGYSCCQVLEQAVTGIDGVDQEALRAYLLANQFDTVMGRIRFKESGLPDATMQLSRWVDGELRIVYPPESSTGEAVLPS
jgi:branched-chain amino acid transport system substrate-binding protein